MSNERILTLVTEAGKEIGRRQIDHSDYFSERPASGEVPSTSLFGKLGQLLGSAISKPSRNTFQYGSSMGMHRNVFEQPITLPEGTFDSTVQKIFDVGNEHSIPVRIAGPNPQAARLVVKDLAR